MRQGILGWTGVVVLAAATSAAEGGAGGGTERLDVSGITLAHLPHRIRDLMLRELDEVLAQAGVGLDWQWEAPASMARPDQLLVIFLDSKGRGTHEGRMILASSSLTGPVTSVWVYLPNVAAALGLRADASPDSLGGMRDLATALARVIAHELVHVLTPDVAHGEGLLSARFHLGQLAQERPRLDSGHARSLLTAARSWRARGGPPPEPQRRAMAAGLHAAP